MMRVYALRGAVSLVLFGLCLLAPVVRFWNGQADPATPTVQPVPTFTATAQPASAAPVAVTPASEMVTATVAVSPPLTASALTTLPVASQVATTTIDPPSAPAVVLLPTPTATATLPAGEQLADGERLHRYGDYAAARSEFSQVINNPNTDQRTRMQARYELARTYLAEGAAGEALSTLVLLDQDLSAAGADPNEFAAKEHFLRAEAFVGQQQYSQAIASYWRFLESYPWMAEIVQARIAVAYEALGDPTAATAAYRRAADAARDTVARLRLLEDLAQSYSTAGEYRNAVAVYDEILGVAQKGGFRGEMQEPAGAGPEPANGGVRQRTKRRKVALPMPR